jgi:hypothetical protein
MKIHAALFLALAACGDNIAPPFVDLSAEDQPDAQLPADDVCDPATVLPSNYRLIGEVSTGAVAFAPTATGTAGTIDATAGGLSKAADKPYIYVDLAAGAKVELDDVAARTSTAWDIALKRSSLRINGGDSGIGERTLTTVLAATLDEVAAVPATPFLADDFTTDDCTLDIIPGGEPRSAFGEWYDYNPETHAVSPKAEVYVVARPDGTHAALRVITYNGDVANPMRGAYYSVEWKPLP